MPMGSIFAESPGANFSIPIVLHMLWNSPLTLPFHILQLAIGAAGWFVVFGLVQQGLYQVRNEQLRTVQAHQNTA